MALDPAEAMNAGGRALINERVELVRAGEIVGSTATGSRGEWSLTNVMPGDYVVRVIVNGQVAGIRVSVTPGQTVANALIVAPLARLHRRQRFLLPSACLAVSWLAVPLSQSLSPRWC